MAIEGFFNHLVTIITPGSSVNRYHQTEKNWSTATSRTAYGYLTQRSSGEVKEGDTREAVIADWILFLPFDDPITNRDRVQYDNATFEVVDRPHKARNPVETHHIEVGLRTVTG